MKSLKRDLQLNGGNVEMCLGQKSVFEHAIHALRRRSFEELTEAILLIDTRTALKTLNRDLALKTSESFVPQFKQQSQTLTTPHQNFPLINEQSSLKKEQHKVIQ